MRNTFRILFYIKRTAPDRYGRVPVMVRITINGERAQFSTQQHVDPRIWDAHDGRVTGRTAAASRINSLPGIYLSYGVFCGFGVGLGYNTAISLTVRWFPDKQGLVSGVTLMGFGFGGMLLGTLGAQMITTLGWRPTFLIFAVVFAVIVLICAFLMRWADDHFVRAMAAGGGAIQAAYEELAK